jgi:hypothetical protein
MYLSPAEGRLQPLHPRGNGWRTPLRLAEEVAASSHPRRIQRAPTAVRRRRSPRRTGDSRLAADSSRRGGRSPIIERTTGRPPTKEPPFALRSSDGAVRLRTRLVRTARTGRPYRFDAVHRRSHAPGVLVRRPAPPSTLRPSRTPPVGGTSPTPCLCERTVARLQLFAHSITRGRAVE